MAFSLTLLLLCSPTVDGQQFVTHRTSLDSAGHEGVGASLNPSVSDDGRHLAFQSTAPLAPLASGFTDVYVRDRIDGTTVLISLNSAGGQGAGSSGVSAISQDGRFIAFESLAANLVAGDGNGARDIFLRDRDPDLDGFFDEPNSTTIRVSVSNAGVQANADCNTPDISDDGQVIAFQSAASNLFAGANNGIAQVFARVLTTSRTELISRAQGGFPGDGASAFPAVSADGSVIAFESRATNLVAGDTNGWDDVFRVDLISIALTRASLSVPGTQSALYSQRPSLNHDGTEIAFQSPADDLVALDTNGSFDVFVRSAGSWSPQLLLDPLHRGQSASAKVCNTTPSETVYLAYSLAGTGAGPCPPPLGGLCLDILAPRLFGSQAASSLGSADFSATIPASAALAPVYVQALIPRGVGGSLSVKSNVVTEVIQP